MAEKELNVRILHAYKTESEWSSSNPVLKAGEVGYVNDSNNPNYGRYKVGDGTKHWNELNYADKGIYDKVDGIEIGGRNLQLGSQYWDSTAWLDKTNVIIDGEVAKMKTPNYPKCYPIPIELNQLYTVSFDIKADVDSEITPTYGLMLLDFFDGSNSRVTNEWVTGSYDSTWKRISYTFTSPSDTNVVSVSLGIRNTNGIEYVYFRHLKLEKGNKATDWTPAPEDKANVSHTHSASDITSGTLSSSRIPTVPVPKGGTGLTTLTSGQVLIGNGTGNVTTRAIDTTSGGTSGSTSLITSGAVYAGLSGKANSSHTHSYLPLSGGTLSGDLNFSHTSSATPGYIGWNTGSSRQRLKINDGSTGDSSVFVFQQSTDSGSNYSDLFSISANGKVTANTFVGALSGNASTSSKWATARTLSLTGAVTGSATIDGSGNVSLATSVNHTHNYAGSSSAGGAATTASSLLSPGILDTQEKIDNFITPNKLQYSLFKTTDANNIGMGSNDGMLLSIPWSSTTYGAQIAFDDSTSATVKVRGKTNNWGNWYKLLHSGNYTDYTVTKTGSGASGTWGISVSGNAATSTKLATARSISLGTGVSSTATNFDGSANITIPVMGIKESYLTWGGRNLAGNITPIGMACSNEHNANRLAFINGNALTFEYSSDAGATWTNYNYDASTKSAFCTKSITVPVGRASSSTVYTTNSKSRVTISAQSYIYTDPRKLLINISSSGGMNVLIEYKTGASDASWQTFGTYSLSGWSGWNDIPLVLSTLGGGPSQTSNVWFLRLTFSMTSVNSSYNTTALVHAIRLFGTNSWTSASAVNNKGPMSSTGHLYSYDINANATFPGTVKASGFDGNASTATALTTSAGTATQPIYFSSGKPVACTYTLNKSVPSDAVFTDTHYTSHLYVGASGGNANATSAISNPYLLCVDNSTNRNSIQLKAGSNMSISAVNGVITFTSSYTNTTYSAGTGLSLSGTTFNHSNSVTAGTAQGDANKTLTFGGTFTIPTVTYDAQGHITGKGTTTMTMPANPNTDTKVIQTAVTASSYTNWRPLIIGASNSGTEGFTPTTTTDGVYSVNTLSCQPSSGTIKATTFKGALSGNASTATKATQDSAGQQINTTYIKGLSVSGKTITYTRGDGGTGTITTQDTVYTHPTTAGNKHIPSGGSSGQILRWSADGTAVWGADNNTTYSTGTASTAGLTKLYTSTGTATDGTMTQAAINSALASKSVVKIVRWS